MCMTNEILLHVISFLWCLVVWSKNKFSPNPALSRFQFLYLASFSSIYEIRVMESAPFVFTVNDREMEKHIMKHWCQSLGIILWGQNLSCLTVWFVFVCTAARISLLTQSPFWWEKGHWLCSWTDADSKAERVLPNTWSQSDASQQVYHPYSDVYVIMHYWQLSSYSQTVGFELWKKRWTEDWAGFGNRSGLVDLSGPGISRSEAGVLHTLGVHFWIKVMPVVMCKFTGKICLR